MCVCLGGGGGTILFDCMYICVVNLSPANEYGLGGSLVIR